MPELETLDGQPVEPVTDPAPGQDDQAPPPRPPGQPPADKPKRADNRKPKTDQARVTRSPAITLDDKQRAEGVKGMVQIGAGVALLAGKATGKDAFRADAVTIVNAGDPIADACVQLARSDAKFAAALDKVCSAGPYAALITIAVGVGSQVARNHKPDLKIPGTVDPAELLKPEESEPVNA
jgi:hypothetical protein